MFLKKTIFTITIIVFIIFICEISFRLFNPYQSRIRGNEIILKSNYKKKYIIDTPRKELDEEIIYTTNSLGFRGTEPPKNWEKSLTIITVGSSTTECHLLADDSTWTARLMNKMKPKIFNLWMNNAGINGCSTFGHIILLRDYIVKLKPKYIIFLLGGNEVGKISFENENGFLINRNENILNKIFKHSEFFTSISNFLEAHKAKHMNFSKNKIVSNIYIYNNGNSKSNSIFEISVAKYIQRISVIDSLCKSNNIKPIFVTHTEYDDGTINAWKPMKLYNNALLNYCLEKKLPIIDLEKQFPNNDSEMFYDFVHYSNKGAEKVATILYPEVMKIINEK